MKRYLVISLISVVLVLSLIFVSWRTANFIRDSDFFEFSPLSNLILVVILVVVVFLLVAKRNSFGGES